MALWDSSTGEHLRVLWHCSRPRSSDSFGTAAGPFCNFTLCWGLQRQTVSAAQVELHLLLRAALEELQRSAQTRQTAIALLPARLLHATTTSPLAEEGAARCWPCALLALLTGCYTCILLSLQLLNSILTTPRSDQTATTAVSAAMPCMGLSSCKDCRLQTVKACFLQLPSLRWSKPAQSLPCLLLATYYLISTYCLLTIYLLFKSATYYLITTY